MRDSCERENGKGKGKELPILCNDRGRFVKSKWVNVEKQLKRFFWKERQNYVGGIIKRIWKINVMRRIYCYVISLKQNLSENLELKREDECIYELYCCIL